MPPVTPRQLFSDISAGKFSPVYYFFGSEDYRIVEAEKYIAGRFLPHQQWTTNYRRLDGRRTSCSDVIAELSVYPMLGERQLFAVTDFQGFKPTEVKQILSMLSPEDPNRVVVLSSPASRSPKKSSAFYKNIVGAAKVVEFAKLTPKVTEGTIVRKLKKDGLEIEKPALDVLTELVAGNRGALEAETDKLINFVGPGSTITADHVRQIAAGYEVFTVFTVAENILKGDAARVLRQIHLLLAEGTSVTGIMFFLGQHFLSLYQVKNGRPLEPRRRWQEGRLRDQAGQFSNEQLEEIIQVIAGADRDVRYGGMKAEAILEQLVLQLIGGRKRAHG
jgi:DNA polymerase-3 subunit delta